MAKKVLKEGELPSVFDLVQSVDKTAEIIAESAYSNIETWYPTGSYILNAAMSGDLFKAIPSGRVVTFQGDSGCLPAGETVEIYIMHNDKHHEIVDRTEK